MEGWREGGMEGGWVGGWKRGREGGSYRAKTEHKSTLPEARTTHLSIMSEEMIWII